MSMSGETTARVRANSFAGVFLLTTGIALAILERNVAMAATFVLVGLFFLTRALAQHRSSDER